MMSQAKKNINPQKSALFTSKQDIVFRRARATLIGGSREKNLLNYFFSIFFLIILHIVV